jgi:two-component system KDP operon response regulator KdpE
MIASSILVIGDDVNLLRILRRNLLAHGYNVELALDDEDACDFASHQCFDVNIVDLDFTNSAVNGVELCTTLRKICVSPILVLAGGGDKDIREKVLSGIADGFLEKPFSMEIFLAHVRAKLRLWSTIRGDNSEETPTTIGGDIFIDPNRHEVQVAGEVVHLTPKEFDVLNYLARNEGRVVTHQELINAVWGAEYGSVREDLRVFISQIRKKVEEDPNNPKYILTEPAVGYRFSSS